MVAEKQRVEKEDEEEESVVQPVHEEEKISLTDKIKAMFINMFEVEDQSISK